MCVRSVTVIPFTSIQWQKRRKGQKRNKDDGKIAEMKKEGKEGGMEGKEEKERMKRGKNKRKKGREDGREGRLFSICVIYSQNLSNLPLCSTEGKGVD